MDEYLLLVAAKLKVDRLRAQREQRMQAEAPRAWLGRAEPGRSTLRPVARTRSFELERREQS